MQIPHRRARCCKEEKSQGDRMRERAAEGPAIAKLRHSGVDEPDRESFEVEFGSPGATT
jgi:hypothetical protein